MKVQTPAMLSLIVVPALLCFSTGGGQGQPVSAQVSGAEVPSNGKLEIHPPTVSHPFYHFTWEIPLEQPSQLKVKRLEANGKEIHSFEIEEKGEIEDPARPKRTRRLAIHEAVISPRPEKTFHSPVLVGRLDWSNEGEYSVTADLLFGGNENEPHRFQARGRAPSSGGYWNRDWKRYQSVVLTETAHLERKREPVRVTLLFYPDQLSDPQREIRVVRYNPDRQTHTPVPAQVLDDSLVDREEPPMFNEQGEPKPKTFLPTRSVTLAFPADVPAGESAVYLVFHDNPDAAQTEEKTDLRVTGKRPGVEIENRHYRFKLHPLSGMLDEVTLKSKPDFTLVHKKETNGAIQWNPGCYAPPRAWAHLSDWEPGKYDYHYHEQLGPVEFQTRRWGLMPEMPELDCSMEYEFYSGVPYFKMRSTVRVKYDTPVQALRNAEVVFAREVFREAAWRDPLTDRVETREITAEPDLTEWVLPERTPWLAFFDREKGIGYAGIQIRSMNLGMEKRYRDYNPYLYITTGPWIYWTRALLYPYGSRNPQQLIEVAAGSLFLEEWAYLPFVLPSGGDSLFGEVDRWTRILTHPLVVHVVDPTDERMQVPEEIYLEPEKTGWEANEQ